MIIIKYSCDVQKKNKKRQIHVGFNGQNKLVLRIKLNYFQTTSAITIHPEAAGQECFLCICWPVNTYLQPCGEKSHKGGGRNKK